MSRLSDLANQSDLFDEEHAKANLAGARIKWNEDIHGDGGHCPVCERWGKIYKRNINRTMAMSLLWLNQNSLWENDERQWVDVPKTAPRWLVRSNQLPTLAWWGIVERAPSNDKSLKHSGLWRPTAIGDAFAMGKVSIRRGVFTYNNKVQGFTNERVYIHECFKTRFDYEEVMNGRMS
jgi:hypothetical protein